MRKLIVATVVGALLSHGANAEAYECTDVPNALPRLSQGWNQRCLPYFISTAGTLFGTDCEPTPSPLCTARRQLILQSFGVWSAPNCTDLDFRDFGYTNQSPGFNPNRTDNENLIISIEDRTTANEIFTRGELAITVTSFNTATGEIFDADIMVNEFDFDFDEVADVGACKDQTPPLPYDLRNTLVHEMGHFIGFEHDLNDDSTMLASADTCEIKKRDLSQDNLLGLCNVYGSLQPTRVCFPPDTYDKGPGDPSDFRNQCDRAALTTGCGCSAAQTGSSAWWLVLIGLLWCARKRTGFSGR